MNMRMLGSQELSRRWGYIVDMVDRALHHGGGSVTSYGLFIQCLAAQAQCWISEDAYGSIKGVAITRYEEQEGTKFLAVVAATAPEIFAKHGDEVLATFEDFAKSTDCEKMVIYGRKGWVRALKQYGYEEPYVTLMKEI